MAQNTATQQDSKLVWQGGNEPLRSEERRVGKECSS